LHEKCGGYLSIEAKSFKADEVPRRLPRHVDSQRSRKIKEVANSIGIGVLLGLEITHRLGWIDKMVVQAFGAILSGNFEKRLPA